MGHMAGAFSVVLGFVTLAGTPNVAGSLNPFSVFGVMAGFFLVGFGDYRKSRDPGVVRRMAISFLWLMLALVAIGTRDWWLTPLVRSFPGIGQVMPLLAVVCVVSLGVSLWLTEDDASQRRWNTLGLCGIAAVFSGAITAVAGGPLAPIGVAALLLGAGLMAIMLGLRDRVLDRLTPNTPND